MSTILVTYATLSGSTVEVAQAVGEELANQGHEVDVLPVGKVYNLEAYDAVVVGGPMIMGYHRDAVKFLADNRETLKDRPLAVFLTAMSLTDLGEKEIQGTPVCIDPNLAKAPKNPGRMSFKERYARAGSYAGPIFKALNGMHPTSLAFFGGALDFRRMKLLAMLFVLLVVQAQPGDRRDFKLIRAWAAGLPGLFSSNQN